MAMNLQELCRLCAAKDEFSKDLLDESNKNVLKMIQDIIQIFVSTVLNVIPRKYKTLASLEGLLGSSS